MSITIDVSQWFFRQDFSSLLKRWVRLLCLKYLSGPLYVSVILIHVLSISCLCQLQSYFQILVNKILDFLLFLKKGCVYVCTHHYSGLKITVVTPTLFQVPQWWRVSSFRPACFSSWPALLPSWSLKLSLTCCDWVSEITCFFLLPLDFLTPLFSWRSCPCKFGFLFLPWVFPVTCSWQPGGAMEPLSSDRQKKVSVVKVLLLQLRQKLLRSTLELFPLLYFSPSPLWPLGKSADSVWEPSVMGGGCKQEGKYGDWGQSRQKDCGLRPQGILCSDWSRGQEVGRRHGIFCPPGF